MEKLILICLAVAAVLFVVGLVNSRSKKPGAEPGPPTGSTNRYN